MILKRLSSCQLVPDLPSSGSSNDIEPIVKEEKEDEVDMINKTIDKTLPKASDDDTNTDAHHTIVEKILSWDPFYKFEDVGRLEKILKKDNIDGDLFDEIGKEGGIGPLVVRPVVGLGEATDSAMGDYVKFCRGLSHLKERQGGWNPARMGEPILPNGGVKAGLGDIKVEKIL